MSQVVEASRAVMLRALFVSAACVLAHGHAYALNPCNSPVPPKSCGGGDPPPPPPPPAPPPPPPPLQRPQIDSLGDDLDYRIYVGVKAQPADASQVRLFTVQTAPNPAGPWTDAATNAQYLSSGTNIATYAYSAPMPQLCTRARVHRTVSDYSPWSAVKCAYQAPLPTSITVKINVNSITVRWYDNSTMDAAYDIMYRPAWSSTYSLQLVGGNNGVTGFREVTIPVTNPFTSMCVVMWPLEIPPGYVGGYAPSDFSDSTPMAPHHWKSVEVCGGYNV